MYNHALRVCRVAKESEQPLEQAWAALQPVFDAELAKCRNANFEFSTLSASYVGNLDFQTSEYDLEQLFGESGTVNSANIINDRDTGRSKGFGFVEMNDNSQGQAAIQALNLKEVDGRCLTVNEARPREERGGGGGGGGRGYGGGGGGGGRGGRGGGGGGGGGRW